MKKNKIFKGLALLVLTAVLSIGFMGCTDPAQSAGGANTGSKIKPITVKYSELEKWLKNSASATEVNYIEIIEIPESALKGKDSDPKSSGLLGTIIKNSEKKVFLSGLKLEGNKELKTIPSYSFYQLDKLVGINLPASIENVGESAFAGCTGLTGIDLPSSLASIDYLVFQGCIGLISIDLPASLKSIEPSAFFNCTGLTGISVVAGNISYSSENGVLFNKDKTNLIIYPAGKADVSYTVPASVTSIGGTAFCACENLQSINMPTGLKIIEVLGFQGLTGLSSLDLSSCSELTSIGDFAFALCTGLKSINLPASLTSIGRLPFARCASLKNISVAVGNTKYLSESGILFSKDKTMLIAFPAAKADSSYTIPASVTSIEMWAFYNCIGLKSIDLSACTKLSTIGEYAFYGSTDATVKLPNVDINIKAEANVFGEKNNGKGKCTWVKKVLLPKNYTASYKLKEKVQKSCAPNFPDERIGEYE